MHPLFLENFDASGPIISGAHAYTDIGPYATFLIEHIDLETQQHLADPGILERGGGGVRVIGAGSGGGRGYYLE